jgi:hypothetical protein
MSAAVSLPASLYASLLLANGKAAPRRFLDALGPQQGLFVADRCKRKVARCGRRAGKSYGLTAWFLDGMEASPGSRSLYVTLTRPKARQIMWDNAFQRLRREFKLPLRLATRDGQLMVEHDNGSSLWLAGCDNKSEIDKFRGEPFRRAAIDECQAFPEYLQELIEDSIEPALMDLQGELALTGTPSPTLAGYFYEASTGQIPGYSSHHWTVLNNPFLPHAAEFLKELRERNRWDDKNPTLLREWYGEWVEDLEALIYPFTYESNSWLPEGSAPYGLPPGEYVFGMGVDLGFSESSTAFCLVAKRQGTGEVYILKAYTRSRLIPTALAAHVQGVREKVRELTGQGLQVVVDEGALGKGYAEQMRVMGVMCEPAQKSEKRTYQEFVGGLVRMGSAKVDFGSCRELIDEARKLQFDAETGKEDERYRRHCCDAMLYIIRHLVPRYDPQLNPPVPGSTEAINLELKKHKEGLIRAREEKLRKRR